jgi:hypothetical protein
MGIGAIITVNRVDGVVVVILNPKPFESLLTLEAGPVRRDDGELAAKSD